MESNVKFDSAPWDESYELSALHLSFLVQTLLPLHTVKWSETRRHFDSINADIREKFAESDELQCIATGSMAEGYGIPSSVVRNTSRTDPELNNEILSDVDMLYVFTWLKMCTDNNTLREEAISDFKGYYEYIEDNPGYVRICLLNPKAEDDIFVVDPVNGKCYLSGVKFTDKLYDLLSERETVSKQGPAITLTDHSISTRLKLQEGISVDTVMALPGYPWPMVSQGWEERIEHSDWLKEAGILADIFKDGCHVVAVPSKMSNRPEIEWRLSFSASEGKLARGAVTDYQRQCFIYIKILHHQKVKPMGILSSYVFKSVFLHCCERLPVSHWKDYPGNCILYILDVVLECLKKKHVPTFFLPENNLIRHLSYDETQRTVAILQSLRADPITPVLEFTDERLFSRHSVHLPFRRMVSPLLDDMVAFKEHKKPEKSILNGFMKTACNICLFNLAEELGDGSEVLFKYQEGVRHLINIYNLWLKPINHPPDTTLENFINGFGLAIKNQIRCLRFFKAAISLSDEYPGFLSLRGNLAGFYHGASYISGLSTETKEQYLTKAGELFESEKSSDDSVNIDYLVFLVKQNRFEDARLLIEKFLGGMSVGSKNTWYSFDTKEKDCLVEPLKQYVETHGKICGDAVSFALFYLTYCIKRGGPGDEEALKNVLQRFEDHNNERKDGATLTLLNFAKSI